MVPTCWAHMTSSWVISSNAVILFGCSVVLNTLRFWGFGFLGFLGFSWGRVKKLPGYQGKDSFPSQLEFFNS